MSTVVDPDTNEHAVVATEDARAQAPATETLTCPNCGAPADHGQLMCLECGSRLALGYKRPPSWRLPAAVVAVVLLIAGIGVAIALAAVTDNATKTTAAAPTTPAAPNAPADAPPTGSQPTPAPAPSTTTPAPSGGAAAGTSSAATPAPAPAPAAEGWPPGKSGFTVILASMPTKAAADDKLNAAKAAGVTSAAILHSDDFPSLKPGYWVVFDGQYDTIDQAQTQAAADRGKGEFGDAYPRFVSKDPGAKP
jgi:hypothetical protein